MTGKPLFTVLKADIRPCLYSLVRPCWLALPITVLGGRCTAGVGVAVVVVALALGTGFRKDC